MTKTLSEQTASAARRPHKTHRKVNGGALACAVWSQEAENFSRLHGQTEAVQSAKGAFTSEATILFRNIVELEHEAHRRLF
jgi:hypothetical protein